MTNGAIESIDRTIGGPGGPGVDDRILDATRICLSRWGVAKTTAEDIARTAGVSRATVYRLFPGGIATIIDALTTREIALLMGSVSDAMSEATSLETALVAGICTAGTALASDPALQYLITHEPEVLLPYFAFDTIGPVLRYSTESLAPLLTRFAPLRTAEDTVEWGCRMVLSLTFTPGLADVTDSGEVADLVHNYFLPGFTSELFDIEEASASTAQP